MIYIVCIVVPQVKQIREKKLMHHRALRILKSLCMEVTKLNLLDVERIFQLALHKATYVGIPEIVEEIIVSYPSVLSFQHNDISIFQYAIVWRRERVFNLMYQLDAGSKFISRRDHSGNNGLHLAAHLGHEQKISLRASAAGAVLQVQRELQWFKVSFPLLNYVNKIL